MSKFDDDIKFFGVVKTTKLMKRMWIELGTTNGDKTADELIVKK